MRTNDPLPLKQLAVPSLEGGDRLTRVEFERRYEAIAAQGDDRKFELIDGVVYMASPVKQKHAELVAELTAGLHDPSHLPGDPR